MNMDLYPDFAKASYPVTLLQQHHLPRLDEFACPEAVEIDA